MPRFLKHERTPSKLTLTLMGALGSSDLTSSFVAGGGGDCPSSDIILNGYDAFVRLSEEVQVDSTDWSRVKRGEVIGESRRCFVIAWLESRNPNVELEQRDHFVFYSATNRKAEPWDNALLDTNPGCLRSFWYVASMSDHMPLAHSTAA